MIWTPVIASAPHEIWAQIIVLYITQEQASQAGGHRSGLREQKLATSYDDDRSWLTSRPEDTASPGRSGMPPSGGDPNPWYFGNEMTIDGCQGWQPSASSANGSASSGKPPASDGRLPPDNPSATSDPSCHTSTRNHKYNSSAPKNNRNPFRPLKAEDFDTGPYMLSNETPPQMPDHALSHGYPMGGFLGHFIPGQDIPRPVGHQQYADELKAYYFSMSIDSPEVPGPGHAPKTRPESLSPHQGANDPPESGAQRETNEQNRIIKKQNAQDLQSLAAEYRQLDRDQDLKEDAETDEETSQDPRSNGKNCREK